MPQIDLAIINLTIVSVFIIFTISFLYNVISKPVHINKGFFFFNSFSVKGTKTISQNLLKKCFQ